MHNIIYSYSGGNNCLNSGTAQIFVDLCTSVEAILDNQFLFIFPDPSNGIFIIEFTENILEIETTPRRQGTFAATSANTV